MRVTEAPLNFFPNHCLVTGRDDGEVVDFEVDTTAVDPHVYLKREIVEEAGEMLGMVPIRKVLRLQERLDALSQELSELHETLEALTATKTLYERISNGNDA